MVPEKDQIAPLQPDPPSQRTLTAPTKLTRKVKGYLLQTRQPALDVFPIAQD